MNDKELIMSFEPNTIEHLGVKMYSTLPPALAEMIANSYDACAKKVTINLYDVDTNDKKIIIEDDGIGMSFNEVNNYFLRIGRNRRKEGQKETKCNRPVTGKKGLGKLALFGIGDRIIIETIQQNKGVKFILDWGEIKHCKDTHYSPTFELFDSKIISGTKITLEKLKRKTPHSLESLAVSLSMLFNFFNDHFDVLISLNDSEPILIDNKLKYQNIEPEFEWKYLDIVKDLESDYEYKMEIDGSIITTEKPLKPGVRGITLFANGRMVNSPEFFGLSESSHFFSYTTGWFNVNFVDNWEEDVISTNRQSIDWEHFETSELKKYLSSCISIIERQWRELRKSKKQDNISKKANIDVKGWMNKLPDNVHERIETIVDLLDDTPELSEETQQKTIELLHEIAPEYANLHWRNLENEIKMVSEKYYQNADYYTAFIEALKRYTKEVRDKSGSINSSDRSMMGEVFSNRILSVTKKYKRTDGSSFYPKTIKNLEEGQQILSEGVVVGGRNPLQHEEHLELSKTGLFSEKDCLDFLSLLSHLFKRLDDAEKP